jgi:hypothetical protein
MSAATETRSGLPNRVTPFGALEAAPERGLFFGNRGGRFHDVATRQVRGRPWAGRQWIICDPCCEPRRQAFRAAGRKVWETRYTELFFCDEVTALSAGHRPCTECRRAASIAYRTALVRAGLFAGLPTCPEVDAILDAERREGRSKRRHAMDAATLPDAAMIAWNGAAFAIRGSAILAWSHAGYGASLARPMGEVEVLTPPLSIAALRGGYAPVWSFQAD